jgi:hypothetical protein
LLDGGLHEQSHGLLVMSNAESFSLPNIRAQNYNVSSLASISRILIRIRSGFNRIIGYTTGFGVLTHEIREVSGSDPGRIRIILADPYPFQSDVKPNKLKQ